MTAGGYPIGIFGHRAKPREGERNARVWRRVTELVMRYKKKKKALIGNDKGQVLPMDGSDYVNPMTGTPIAR